MLYSHCLGLEQLVEKLNVVSLSRQINDDNDDEEITVEDILKHKIEVPNHVIGNTSN